MMLRHCGGVALVLLALSSLLRPVHAEPWIAVKEGAKCMTCHVNASGGGMRNTYGNLYSQMQLAATQLAKPDAEKWTGRVNDFLAVGGNLRASARQIDTPNQDTQLAFELEEARLYLQFSPLPGRMDVYLDQRIAPGSSTNLEAYARLWSADHEWYLKAGQMYLPYGLRLEDDSAFIRSIPGISFTTPDTGVEIGWENARWTAQLGVSNGTAGGPEADTGKQASGRLEHVRSNWRFGASANVNDTETGTRAMQNVFAGLRTGNIVWLAEIDSIRDESVVGEPLKQHIALVEANWFFRKGHNLKITAERFEPDVDDNDVQERLSVFWEYFPFEFTQLRIGARQYDGDTAIDAQNRSIVVFQLHGYF